MRWGHQAGSSRFWVSNGRTGRGAARRAGQDPGVAGLVHPGGGAGHCDGDELLAGPERRDVDARHGLVADGRSPGIQRGSPERRAKPGRRGLRHSRQSGAEQGRLPERGAGRQAASDRRLFSVSLAHEPIANVAHNNPCMSRVWVRAGDRFGGSGCQRRTGDAAPAGAVRAELRICPWGSCCVRAGRLVGSLRTWPGWRCLVGRQPGRRWRRWDGCWLTISSKLVVGHDVCGSSFVALDGYARPPQGGGPAGWVSSSDWRRPGGDPQPPRLVQEYDCASGRSSPQIERDGNRWMGDLAARQTERAA